MLIESPFVVILMLIFILCIFPFITYCVVVYIDKYEHITFIKDYIKELKRHDLAIIFGTPIINVGAALFAVWIGVGYLCSHTLVILWKMIPRHTQIENWLSDKWEMIVNKFMNIKIK